MSKGSKRGRKPGQVFQVEVKRAVCRAASETAGALERLCAFSEQHPDAKVKAVNKQLEAAFKTLESISESL